MTTNWEQLCERYLDIRNSEFKLPGDPRIEQECKILDELKLRVIDAAAELHTADIGWLLQALENEAKKWFVPFVFDGTALLPEELVAPMVRAAVYEPNPSLNRDFVEPALSFAGVTKHNALHQTYSPKAVRLVNEMLFEYVRTGSDSDVFGACSVLYWVPPGTAFHEPLPESITGMQFVQEDVPDPQYQDLREARTRLFLSTFLNNLDPSVRWQIITQLSLEPDCYPKDLRPDILKVLDIARNHPDSEIRERVPDSENRP